MNVLERALLEKAGHEHGWEHVIESREDVVCLASARHRARARITPAAGGGWCIALPGGRLTRELARSVPVESTDPGRFVVANTDALTRLLHRAAALAQSLPDQAVARFRERLVQTLADIPVNGTEVERLVRQRVGQDAFREALLDYWGGACAVTGLALPEVLRASHAKPWSACDSDEERLDVFNGFLLVANLDALFDRGLISFADSGAMRFSPRLSPEQRAQLRLESTLQLRWLAEEHLPYLAWHRARVFAR